MNDNNSQFVKNKIVNVKQINNQLNVILNNYIFEFEGFFKKNKGWKNIY